MELLGFGRLIDAEGRARMAAGAAWHQTFQRELARGGRLVAVERAVRDPVLGVSGRMDALVRDDDGAVAVVEYKTVGGSRFAEILDHGRPPVTFWAQLALYLEMTGYRRGHLVVDARETPRRRLAFVQEAPGPWGAWVRERVVRARAWAESGKLPPREPGPPCLSCDRWQRCYRTEADREAAVAAHPIWEPDPPLAHLTIRALEPWQEPGEGHEAGEGEQH